MYLNKANKELSQGYSKLKIYIYILFILLHDIYNAFKYIYYSVTKQFNMILF